MVHSSLTEAKKAKKDEFYTQYIDIEREISAYLEYNPKIFLNKTILLPCDDPEWSNFTKYFAQNFELFRLKKLISTSFAVNSKKFKKGYQHSLLEEIDKKFDESKTATNGKVFTLTRDKNKDGKIDIQDLEWDYLEGDGDFNSDEVTKLRDEADFIITNPPFSVWKEFYRWTISADKFFLIIANKNSVTYKQVFPMIKNNQIWAGKTNWSGGLWFETKDKDDVDEVRDGIDMKNVPAIWLTNIDHGRRHEPLSLMSTADNLKFSKYKKIKGKKSYDKYLNYDAIDVPYSAAVPSDYKDLMGVPISFLNKFCPEQFEILGTSDNGMIDDAYKLTNGLPEKFVDDYNSSGGKVSKSSKDPVFYANGKKPIKAYTRIFIRHLGKP